MCACVFSQTAVKCLVGISLFAVFLAGCGAVEAQTRQSDAAGEPSAPSDKAAPKKLETATFGAGCFWCTEAVFQRLKGVQTVVSGYSGGRFKNPTYQQVCSGKTGHAEAVQITYDPKQISYQELLDVFWKTHDPTTPNRQGPDHGNQYRSVIFYHDEQQRKTAEQHKQELDAAKTFRAPIVTKIVPFREFYPAEDYHQNYFKSHPKEPYSMRFIRPKMEKLDKAFHDKLKEPLSRE